MFKRQTFSFRLISSLLIVLFTNLTLFPCARAATFSLPAPNQFVGLSAGFSFPVLKGLRFDPQNPLNIEFIIHKGNKKEISEYEATRLVRYFLAGLTIPEENLWVNLSVNEKDRVISESLGQTELGEGLLSQDYLLKQLLSSLTYPESKTGKNFWEKTYSKIAKISGASNAPVDTYNKIWIMPESSLVYENGNMAVVADAKLKTLLEEDYLALKNASISGTGEKGQVNKAASEAMKEVILDKINKDVNSGKNFATLRQIYQSVILSTWFKKKFKESFYKYYINKEKVSGVDLADADAKDKVYSQYVEAFKTGLYDYVKKEQDPVSNKQVQRRYYSGGATLLGTSSSSLVASNPGKVNSILMSDAKKGFIELFDMEFEALSSPLTKYEVEEETTAVSRDVSVDIAVPVAEIKDGKKNGNIPEAWILEEIDSKAKLAHQDLMNRVKKRRDTFTGWKEWPGEMLSALKKQGMFETAKELAERIKNGEVNDLFIAGIGGSAAPLEAFLDYFYGTGWRDGQSINGVRIYILDTLDGKAIKNAWEGADKDRSAVLVISKSGGTLEPAAVFRYFKDRLIDIQEEDYNKYVYVVTDESKGALRAETDKEGYTVGGTVPDDIGGRYSTFTAVAMFLGAILGGENIVRGIRDGAAAYEKYEKGTDSEKNIAALRIGALAALLNKRFGSNIIFRGYSLRLRGIEKLFTQQFDESIVKEKKGPRTTFVDGLDSELDKVFNGGKNLNIHIVVDKDIEKDSDLQERLNFQYKRLKADGTPQVVIRISEMNAANFGLLIQFMHNIIAYCGEFLLDEPNLTYLQPDVESAKINFKAIDGDTSLKGAEEIIEGLKKIFGGGGRFSFGSVYGTNMGNILASLGTDLSISATSEDRKVYLDLNNLLQTGFTKKEIQARAAQIHKQALGNSTVEEHKKGLRKDDFNSAAYLAAAWQLKAEKSQKAGRTLITDIGVYSRSLFKELFVTKFQSFCAKFGRWVRILEGPAYHHSTQNGSRAGSKEDIFTIFATVDDSGSNLMVPKGDSSFSGKSFDKLMAETVVAVSGAFTQAHSDNVTVTVKDAKDQQYLKNFLELTTVLAGLSSQAKGAQESGVVSSSLERVNAEKLADDLLKEYQDKSARGEDVTRIDKLDSIIRPSAKAIEEYLYKEYLNKKIKAAVYEKKMKNIFLNLAGFYTDPYVQDGTYLGIEYSVKKGYWADLAFSYSGKIAYGTAGVRGIFLFKQFFNRIVRAAKRGLGLKVPFLKGTNTFNDETVRTFTLAVLEFLQEQRPDLDKSKLKLFTAFDSRIAGQELANIIKDIGLAFGVQVYICDEAMPLPEFSIALKELAGGEEGAIGIYISASHNKKTDTGAKLIDFRGMQMGADGVRRKKVMDKFDKKTLKEVHFLLKDNLPKVVPVEQLVYMGGSDEERLPGFEYGNHQLIDTHTMHFEAMLRQITDMEVIKKHSGKIKILHNPFFGASRKATPRILKALGFKVDRLEAMAELNGAFPGFRFKDPPDPALVRSWQIAIRAYLKNHTIDELLEYMLITSGDPDADRLGVLIRVGIDEIPKSKKLREAMGIALVLTEEQQKKYGFGGFKIVPPNEWNALIAYYELKNLRDKGELDPEKHVLVTTHVTSFAIKRIGDYFGVETIMLPVGIDQIAAETLRLAQEGKIVVNGSEESGTFFTYLNGGHILDKDGFLGALKMAEIACAQYEKGQTINDLLDEIYLIKEIGLFGNMNTPWDLPDTVAGEAQKEEAVRWLQKELEPLLKDILAGGENPKIAGKTVHDVDEQKKYRSGKYDPSFWDGFPDAGIRVYFSKLLWSFITNRPSGTQKTIRFYIQEFAETHGLNPHQLHQLKIEVYRECMRVTNKFMKIVKEQDLSAVSSSIDKNTTNRPEQAGGIDLESLNSSVKASSAVSGQGLDIDFKNCVGLTVEMVSRRPIKPEDKMLSFAK